MKPLDYSKIEKLRTLANIPTNMGEQFISVNLNLVWGSAGTISFGFRYKMDMGEYDFSNLDQAIEIVTKLRQKAKPDRG
jgi:hypothetical protein